MHETNLGGAHAHGPDGGRGSLLRDGEAVRRVSVAKVVGDVHCEGQMGKNTTPPFTHTWLKSKVWLFPSLQRPRAESDH